MRNDPERYLTLRQADQARTDFAIIEDELEAIYARVARLPSHGQLWCVCLIGMLGGSVLTAAFDLAFAVVHRGGAGVGKVGVKTINPPLQLVDTPIRDCQLVLVQQHQARFERSTPKDSLK
jgi:hypothetical protein